MSRVILGVAGGIAAYKSCEILRRLREAGHEVRLIPTANALRFVGRLTFEALASHPVTSDVFDGTDQVAHVRHGQEADAILVAPATADLMARVVAGRADDLLTSSLLVATCPVIFAPAMHTEMWFNPATVANVATLRARGYVVVDPADGRLTGPDTGPGRLPEPSELVATLSSVLEFPAIAQQAAKRDLAGVHVVVTAGGTRQFLDPVRFLGNRSSGKMGVALAAAAALRGANVDLIGANLEVAAPAGVTLHHVRTTEELAECTWSFAQSADVVIMAAAPADYRPVEVSERKLKKSDAHSDRVIELTETPDILAGLHARRREGRIDVGFAAETASDTAELIELGRKKLLRKGCALLVCNNVSQGAVFGAEGTDIVVLDSLTESHFSGSKNVAAHHIIDRLWSVNDAIHV